MLQIDAINKCKIGGLKAKCYNFGLSHSSAKYCDISQPYPLSTGAVKPQISALIHGREPEKVNFLTGVKKESYYFK